MYYLRKGEMYIVSTTLPSKNLDKYEQITKEEYDAYLAELEAAAALEEDSN